ncbi:hypothetical protein AVEN_76459-1 [Araneus ventricosus]|uniref:Uncharacterized protein n=1 Tax=Araneus ventricosus TaxID=182803 RepID=A0A4Y2RRW6_ARAVE|nr:hypothetical protein AVEN_76459-1 [Araneus ventricosus]
MIRSRRDVFSLQRPKTKEQVGDVVEVFVPRKEPTLPTSEIILDRDVPTLVYDAEILSYLFHKINVLHINPTHTNHRSGISPSDTLTIFSLLSTQPVMTSKPRPYALHHQNSTENGKLSPTRNCINLICII